MKKVIYSIAVLLIAATQLVNAQVDRSKLPEAGPARDIKIGDYESFTLKNGLKVFVIENNKLPRVAFRLVLDREPLKEDDKVGYLSMVGQLMRRGTTTRSKEQLDEEVDFIGASLGAGSSNIFASGLSKHQEKVIELMADVLLNPTFPEEELEKIKTQAISGLASQKDDPNAISGNLTSVLLYGKDHPYGEIQTEETTNNITVEDIKKYYSTYFKPNIAYLAIVGDIKKKDAEKLVKKYLGKWEMGDVPVSEYDTPKAPEKTFVALVNRASSVQSVIDVTHPVNLKPGTEDVIPARVMNNILGGGGSARLFMNLREDKGYTYGAYSSLSSDELVGNFSASASVRNEVTDSSVVEFMKELNNVRNEKVSDEEMRLAINSISGSFARSLESPQTVASFAINTEIQKLPNDYYATYLQRVQAVTKEDIQRVAQKYIRPDNAYITVVGKASEVADKLKKFGEIKYYDTDGNEYDPTKEQLPEGLTSQKVIDAYVVALGGKEKIESLKSVQMEMSANAMGNTLDIKQVKKAPGMYYNGVTMAGNVMMEQKTNGSEYSVKSQGRNVPLDDNTKFQLQLESNVVPELKFKELSVKSKLIGIEAIDGKKAYAMEITYPGGNKVTSYFDVATSLKVRSTSTVQGPQGEVSLSQDFLDYKAVEGIQFPHLVKIPLGPGFTMEAKVKSIKINEEVSADQFK